MNRWDFELNRCAKKCSDKIWSWRHWKKAPRNAPMRFGVEDRVLKLVKFANLVGGYSQVVERLVKNWWSWRKVVEVGEFGRRLVKLVKSWWKVGEKLVKLVKRWWSWWKVGETWLILVKSWWSWWKVGEFGRELVKLWWKSWSSWKKLVKSWASWWKAGEKFVKLVNLVGGWASWWKVGRKLVKLVKSWSSWSIWSHCVRSGLSTAGDETVRWENCLRTHDTSSTPDTSVQRWGTHHIVFDHYRMVK